jgi:hypothetical protein
MTLIAEPLGYQFLSFLRAALKFCSNRSSQLGKVALLDFEIPIHPVFGENFAFRVMQYPLASQIIEKACDTVAEILGRHAEGMGIFLNPGQRGVKAFIIHLHPSPWFETNGLPGGKRDFPQHLNAEKFPSFLFVATASAFSTDHLPHLGNKGTGKRLVPFQNLIEVHGQIADGNRTVFETLGHEGAQAETTGMILHPACLEGGILPVVAENQETWPFRMVHHVLSQNMHVGHIGRTDRSRRFPVVAADTPPVGPAGEATRKHAWIVSLLPHGIKKHRFPDCTAMAATLHCIGMGGATTAAEIDGSETLMFVEIFVIAAADNLVNEHDSVSTLSFFQRLPEGPIAGKFAAARPSA